MKKSIMAAFIATSVIHGSAAATTQQAEAATVKPPTVNTNTAAKKAVCKTYHACESLNVYIFKAEKPHLLQDLTYFDAYEPHNASRLKVGRYYRVVYSHDTPIKAYIMTPTKSQKIALDRRYKLIKQQQRAEGSALRMSYTYGVQY